ncbi:polyprenyl synthetase family protein [Pseudomonas entomophila]|uniref:polyprenyl synthetase family protein n=1 Tax=Pseudomonas entomophila TaxID=312306 RepID=UPI0021599D40|nr:polyprenyl synthetase family protein [Pseudomonas entomophila]
MSATIDTGIDIHLQQLRDGLERRLDALLPTVGNERDLVALAMRDGTLAPGKRLRPLLLMLATEGLGGPAHAALDLGCAVEMVHAASLVLDDLPCMDDALMRRGRPTVHLTFGQDVAILTFGQDVAILAAIALLSRAFAVIAAIEHIPALARTQLVTRLSEAVGSQGLVQGQFQDLHDGTQARTAAQIATTNQLKTGVLFSSILDMACIISDASPQCRALLGQFAQDLGQAFQLHDDLCDCDPASGKDLGKDAGKSTLVALCGEAEVRERLLEHLARADDCLARSLGGSETLGRYVQAMFAKMRG